LLFNWGSKKSKYDGQRGDEYCYNVNVGDGTLCCGAPYDPEKGFGNGAVCYLENSFDCHDLHQAVFVADGEITMDIDLIGKRAFPNIQTGNGFLIDSDPSSGTSSAPFDYVVRAGIQNGLVTKLTGNAPTMPNKSFLLSGWDESQTPSDHEIEWAGPSPLGVGGESFAAPAVIMKGGKGAMVYLDDNDGVLHAAGLRTPIDPEDGVNLKTEHVEFCFDYAPPTTSDSFAVFRDGDEGEGEETETTDEEETDAEETSDAEEAEEETADAETEEETTDAKVEEETVDEEETEEEETSDAETEEATEEEEETVDAEAEEETDAPPPPPPPKEDDAGKSPPGIKGKNRHPIRGCLSGAN
jgi:hypothetical protein